MERLKAVITPNIQSILLTISVRFCQIGQGDITSGQLNIAVFVTPHFNISATVSFLDPFRVTGYLTGTTRFSWTLVPETGGHVESSSGMVVDTHPLTGVAKTDPWLVLISSSLAPERQLTPQLRTALLNWDRRGAIIGGLDTGAIVLAAAGLLLGGRETVHYEHIDAFIEVAPDTKLVENMFVMDGRIFTCCGGALSVSSRGARRRAVAKPQAGRANGPCDLRHRPGGD